MGSHTPTPGLDRRGWLMLAGGAALALAACGSDDPHVRYVVAGLPRATSAGCPAQTTTTPPVVPGATKVRFTFRDYDEAALGALRCDVVIPLGGQPPLISVPRRGEPVAMWVEYFDDAGTLLARGQQLGVDIDEGTVTVPTGLVNDYACAPAQAVQGRAFHTATLLPDGTVLLLGGLAGTPTAGGADAFMPESGAYAISAPEIYDPVTRRSARVTIDGLIPRAFHQTVIVSADARRVKLLVIGGHGVEGDPTASGNVAAMPGGGGTAPWTPATVDAAMGRMGAKPIDTEVLVYDLGAKTFTRTLAPNGPTPRFDAGINALGSPGVAAAVVGGRLPGGGSTPLIEGVNPNDGSLRGSIFGRPRVGSAVTLLPDGTAMITGGDVGDIGGVRVADHLRGLDTGAVGIDQGPTGTSATNRGFHAAALYGTDSVLMYGGLHLSANNVEDNGPSDLAGRVAIAGSGTTALDAMGQPAVAYPDAVTLHDGSVLADGGAKPGGTCPMGTIRCPSATSLRFDNDALGVRTTLAGQLGMPRYGHRLVKLVDGTVLVTGGFTSDATDPAKLRATTVVEQFEPHRASDDPLKDLATVMRAPGDIARDLGGMPVAQCGTIGGRVGGLVDGGTDAMPDAPIDAP